ncbi:hypothetical protein ATL40_2752 [Serinibacter salmoneus]|uniref:Uncharacterized protein n=1 Tax=Serinibacter salmoneus TaxID=556530 RepID=A0A2A9D415_9MICO|nr:hypothetical protein ATL40_2752 [Serinibacter salmoneus]
MATRRPVLQGDTTPVTPDDAHDWQAEFGEPLTCDCRTVTWRPIQ